MMDCRFGVVRVLECLSDPQSYRLGTKGRPGRATLDGRVNAFTNAILWSSRMGWGRGGVGLQGQQPYPITTRTLQKLNSLIRLLAWLDDDDDDRYHHHHHHDHHLRVGHVHLGFSSNEYLFLALAIYPNTLTTMDLDFANL